jgi:hypothetical protein
MPKVNGAPKQQSPPSAWALGGLEYRWRRGPESNRTNRICNPGHNRFATAPSIRAMILTKMGSQCGHGASHHVKTKKLERETRLELATSTLARLRSTN